MPSSVGNHKHQFYYPIQTVSNEEDGNEKKNVIFLRKQNKKLSEIKSSLFWLIFSLFFIYLFIFIVHVVQSICYVKFYPEEKNEMVFFCLKISFVFVSMSLLGIGHLFEFSHIFLRHWLPFRLHGEHVVMY